MAHSAYWDGLPPVVNVACHCVVPITIGRRGFCQNHSLCKLSYGGSSELRVDPITSRQIQSHLSQEGFGVALPVECLGALASIGVPVAGAPATACRLVDRHQDSGGMASTKVAALAAG